MNFFKTYWKHLLFVVLFCVYSVVGYNNVREAGIKEGADRVFRHCHDEGGILLNSETSERIGCGAIAVQPKGPLDKPEKKWYNNS